MSTTAMFVRNLQPGPTIFDEDDHILRWEGRGDPTGGDIIPAPSTLAESYGFQRALHFGVLEVVEAGEDTREALNKSKEVWERQMVRRDQLSSASMGQLAAEEGAVAREGDLDSVPPQRKAQVGPGELPKTIDTIVGVEIEDDAANPKIKKTRVRLMPEQSLF